MGCGAAKAQKAQNATTQPQAQVPGIKGEGNSSSSKAPAKIEAWSGVMAQEGGTAVEHQPNEPEQERIISALTSAQNGTVDTKPLPSETGEQAPSLATDMVDSSPKAAHRRRSDGDLLANNNLATLGSEVVASTPPKGRRTSLTSQSSKSSLFAESPPKARRSSVGVLPTMDRSRTSEQGQEAPRMGRRRSETSVLASGSGLANFAPVDQDTGQTEGGKVPLGRRRSLQATLNAGVTLTGAISKMAPATTEAETNEEEVEEAPKPTLGRRRSFESAMATNAQNPVRPRVTKTSIDGTESQTTEDSRSTQGVKSQQLGKRRLSANQIVGGEKSQFAQVKVSSGNTVGRQQSVKDAVIRSAQNDF